jgi:hypothetical protein
MKPVLGEPRMMVRTKSGGRKESVNRTGAQVAVMQDLDVSEWDYTKLLKHQDAVVGYSAACPVAHSCSVGEKPMGCTTDGDIGSEM